MPTGYYAEVAAENDVASGAIYDRGVYVYASGQLGPFNDDYGRSICENFLVKEMPDFVPAKILDMGCTVGHSTLPYAEYFPEAEIHAIDVGAPVLRYAHARAQILGTTVHFSQQNAEHTSFPDGSFDLVVSHILLHETNTAALRNIIAECHRLLAPGGVMIHAEVPQYEGLDPFTQFLADWDTYNNNEPFWGAMHDADLEQLAVDAGFARDRVRTAAVPTGRRLQTGARVGQLALTVAQR